MGNIIKATRLTEKGYPYSLVRELCHMEGSPFFQKKEGGTWWVDEVKFEKFLEKLAAKKGAEYA